MKKIKRKNPKQVSFAEREFFSAASRGNSYQSVLELIDRLKSKLRNRYNHLVFDDPNKIFEFEKTLLMLLETLE